MRFYYCHQPFLSHARVALEYQRILRKVWDETDSPDDANMAILHYEPPFYDGLLQRTPALNDVYHVGYCVWEADRLPDAWVTAVGLMNELWVPAAYCYEAFSRVHPRVRWLPHVAVCPRRDTPDEVVAMRALLDVPEGAFVYLNITHAQMPRKNLEGLLKAFALVKHDVPEAHLVVKVTPQDDAPVRVERRGDVTLLHGVLNPAPLHALYALCDVYVSAHHAEGWGLPMSDAMLLGKPVVATGYSGNLDFMTNANSWLIPAVEAPISARDAYYLFAAPMRWGDVKVEDIASQLRIVHADCVSGAARARVRTAHDDIALFDAAHVRTRITVLMAELEARLAPVQAR